MVGLTLLGLVAGSITFAFNYRTQQRFLTDTTPFLVNVEEVSRASVRFTSTIDELRAVETLERLDRVLVDHRVELDALKAGILRLLEQKSDFQSAADLEDLVQHLAALETPYGNALRVRIDASNRLDQLQRAVSSEVRRLLDQLSPHLLDASLEMIDLIQSDQREHDARLEKLNRTWNEVRLLTEISSAAETFLQANFVSQLEWQEAPTTLREAIAPELRQLTQLALKLENAEQRELLATSLIAFNDKSLASSGIADQSRRLADAISKLEKLSESQIGLVTEMTEIVNDVVTNARRDFFKAAESTQQQSLIAVTALAILLITALVCVVWIGWRIINRDIAQRLERLAMSTVSLADGDLDVQIDQSGKDELASMARAVETFRQNARALRRSQDELLAYAQELERSNAELDDFAYVASHDLKEPLRAAQNHASFLIEDYDDRLDEDGQHRLRRLMELNQRMEKLIADLFYFSRLGRGGEAFETLDVNALISRIKADLAERIQRTNTMIAVADSLPKVQGIETHLMVLFRNLISNGIKYNEADAKLIEIGPLPSPPNGASKGMITFFVRDNGIGIEDEFKDEIFRIFKRLNSEKAYGEGTGAGLSFVKKIVERQGGKIWFESTPGEGTTFIFTLPAAKDRANSNEHLIAA